MAESDKDKLKLKVTVDQVEALLGQLPGVLSSRIVVNDWGAIEEVHVLATTERSAKQLVRDVESSLAARWGMNIDHKKISVAQVTGMEPTLPPVRLLLSNVQSVVDTSRGLMEITVTLALPDDDEVTFSGRASGPYSRHHSLRLAAQATVDALNQTIAARHIFSLEDVKLVVAAGYELVVAVVALITPRGEEETLVGAALMLYEPVEAAARATLQATNRRLGRLFLRRRRGRPKPDAAAAPAGGGPPRDVPPRDVPPRDVPGEPPAGGEDLG
jgi:hypothetical protein